MRSLRPPLCLLLVALLALAAPAGAHVRFHGPLAHAADFVPNDPGRPTDPVGWQALQWNFAGPFGIGAETAWDNLVAVGRPGGRGITVAVLDTGVGYANRGRYRRSPDLNAGSFVRGYDFIDHDPYASDPEGHGTFVASTIAEATNNGFGLTGLAYGVRIMPVRVLDRTGAGDSSTIAKGVRFAVRHGAKVINMSLEFDLNVTASEITSLIRAIDYAHRRGAIVVAASGNEAYTAVAYPARANYVVSVGATTEHGCLADYSNQGHGLDLVAPGGGPDGYVPDDPDCRTAGPSGHSIAQIGYVDGHRHFGIDHQQGTSMAVPHVSATAALVMASGVIGPHPTPTAVLQRMEATARDLGPAGYDTSYGWGLVDAGAATTPGGPTVPAPPPSTSSG